MEMISDKSRSAALPYIGIILEDLLKLDELPQLSEDRVYINWSKMQKVAVNFHLVRTLQQRRYDFEEVQVCSTFSGHLLTFS